MEEELDLFFAKPFNIERIARYEMTNALYRLSSASQTACAAIDRFAFFTHRMAATDRAFMREMERHSICWALLQHHIDNLSNDIAGALHDHRIADANVVFLIADTFALEANSLDVVFIMQRRIGDNHTADGNRFKACNRCQRACTSNLNVYATQDRRRLFCREFMRNGPARAA